MQPGDQGHVLNLVINLANNIGEINNYVEAIQTVFGSRQVTINLVGEADMSKVVQSVGTAKSSVESLSQAATIATDNLEELQKQTDTAAKELDKYLKGASKKIASAAPGAERGKVVSQLTERYVKRQKPQVLDPTAQIVDEYVKARERMGSSSLGVNFAGIKDAREKIKADIEKVGTTIIRTADILSGLEQDVDRAVKRVATKTKLKDDGSSRAKGAILRETTKRIADVDAAKDAAKKKRQELDDLQEQINELKRQERELKAREDVLRNDFAQPGELNAVQSSYEELIEARLRLKRAAAADPQNEQLKELVNTEDIDIIRQIHSELVGSTNAAHEFTKAIEGLIGPLERVETLRSQGVGPRGTAGGAPAGAPSAAVFDPTQFNALQNSLVELVASIKALTARFVPGAALPEGEAPQKEAAAPQITKETATLLEPTVDKQHIIRQIQEAKKEACTYELQPNINIEALKEQFRTAFASVIDESLQSGFGKVTPQSFAAFENSWREMLQRMAKLQFEDSSAYNKRFQEAFGRENDKRVAALATSFAKKNPQAEFTKALQEAKAGGQKIADFAYQYATNHPRTKFAEALKDLDFLEKDQFASRFALKNPRSLTESISRRLAEAFKPENLPSIVPKVATKHIESEVKNALQAAFKSPFKATLDGNHLKQQLLSVINEVSTQAKITVGAVPKTAKVGAGADDVVAGIEDATGGSGRKARSSLTRKEVERRARNRRAEERRRFALATRDDPGKLLEEFGASPELIEATRKMQQGFSNLNEAGLSTEEARRRAESALEMLHVFEKLFQEFKAIAPKFEGEVPDPEGLKNRLGAALRFYTTPISRARRNLAQTHFQNALRERIDPLDKARYQEQVVKPMEEQFLRFQTSRPDFSFDQDRDAYKEQLVAYRNVISQVRRWEKDVLGLRTAVTTEEKRQALIRVQSAQKDVELAEETLRLEILRSRGQVKTRLFDADLKTPLRTAVGGDQAAFTTGDAAYRIVRDVLRSNIEPGLAAFNASVQQQRKALIEQGAPERAAGFQEIGFDEFARGVFGGNQEFVNALLTAKGHTAEILSDTTKRKAIIDSEINALRQEFGVYEQLTAEVQEQVGHMRAVQRLELARARRARTPLGLARTIRGASYTIGGVAIGVAAGLRVRQSFSTFIELEQKMKDVQGILNVTETEMQQVAVGISHSARRFGADLLQTADAARVLAQAGFTTSEVLRELDYTLLGMRAMGVTIEQMQELQVAVRALGGNTLDVLSKISKVEAEFAVTAQDLADAIKVAAPIVNQYTDDISGLGDAFDFTNALATAAVQQLRISGREAGNALKFVLARLVQPATSNRLTKEFQFEYFKPGGKELLEIPDLFEAIKDKYEQLKRDVGGERALEFLVTVAGGRRANFLAALLEQYDTILEVTRKSRYAFGDAQRRAALSTDTLNVSLQKFNTNFNLFVQNMLNGVGAADGLRFAVEQLAKVFGGFSGQGAGLGTVLGLTLAGSLGVKGGKKLFQAAEFASLGLPVGKTFAGLRNRRRLELAETIAESSLTTPGASAAGGRAFALGASPVVAATEIRTGLATGVGNAAVIAGTMGALGKDAGKVAQGVTKTTKFLPLITKGFGAFVRFLGPAGFLVGLLALASSLTGHLSRAYDRYKKGPRVNARVAKLITLEELDIFNAPQTGAFTDAAKRSGFKDIEQAFRGVTTGALSPEFQKFLGIEGGSVDDVLTAITNKLEDVRKGTESAFRTEGLEAFIAGMGEVGKGLRGIENDALRSATAMQLIFGAAFAANAQLQQNLQEVSRVATLAQSESLEGLNRALASGKRTAILPGADNAGILRNVLRSAGLDESFLAGFDDKGLKGPLDSFARAVDRVVRGFEDAGQSSVELSVFLQRLAQEAPEGSAAFKQFVAQSAQAFLRREDIREIIGTTFDAALTTQDPDPTRAAQAYIAQLFAATRAEIEREIIARTTDNNKLAVLLQRLDEMFGAGAAATAAKALEGMTEEANHFRDALTDMINSMITEMKKFEIEGALADKFGFTFDAGAELTRIGREFITRIGLFEIESLQELQRARREVIAVNASIRNEPIDDETPDPEEFTRGMQFSAEQLRAVQEQLGRRGLKTIDQYNQLRKAFNAIRSEKLTIEKLFGDTDEGRELVGIYDQLLQSLLGIKGAGKFEVLSVEIQERQIRLGQALTRAAKEREFRVERRGKAAEAEQKILDASLEIELDKNRLFAAQQKERESALRLELERLDAQLQNHDIERIDYEFRKRALQDEFARNSLLETRLELLRRTNELTLQTRENITSATAGLKATLSDVSGLVKSTGRDLVQNILGPLASTLHNRLIENLINDLNKRLATSKFAVKIFSDPELGLRDAVVKAHDLGGDLAAGAIYNAFVRGTQLLAPISLPTGPVVRTPTPFTGDVQPLLGGDDPWWKRIFSRNRASAATTSRSLLLPPIDVTPEGDAKSTEVNALLSRMLDSGLFTHLQKLVTPLGGKGVPVSIVDLNTQGPRGLDPTALAGYDKAQDRIVIDPARAAASKRSIESILSHEFGHAYKDRAADPGLLAQMSLGFAKYKAQGGGGYRSKNFEEYFAEVFAEVTEDLEKLRAYPDQGVAAMQLRAIDSLRPGAKALADALLASEAYKDHPASTYAGNFQPLMEEPDPPFLRNFLRRALESSRAVISAVMDDFRSLNRVVASGVGPAALAAKTAQKITGEQPELRPGDVGRALRGGAVLAFPAAMGIETAIGTALTRDPKFAYEEGAFSSALRGFHLDDEFQRWVQQHPVLGTGATLAGGVLGGAPADLGAARLAPTLAKTRLLDNWKMRRRERKLVEIERDADEALLLADRAFAESFGITETAFARPKQDPGPAAARVWRRLLNYDDPAESFREILAGMRDEVQNRELWQSDPALATRMGFWAPGSERGARERLTRLVDKFAEVEDVVPIVEAALSGNAETLAKFQRKYKGQGDLFNVIGTFGRQMGPEIQAQQAAAKAAAEAARRTPEALTSRLNKIFAENVTKQLLDDPTGIYFESFQSSIRHRRGGGDELADDLLAFNRAQRITRKKNEVQNFKASYESIFRLFDEYRNRVGGRVGYGQEGPELLESDIAAGVLTRKQADMLSEVQDGIHRFRKRVEHELTERGAPLSVLSAETTTDALFRRFTEEFKAAGAAQPLSVTNIRDLSQSISPRRSQGLISAADIQSSLSNQDVIRSSLRETLEGHFSKLLAAAQEDFPNLRVLQTDHVAGQNLGWWGLFHPRRSRPFSSTPDAFGSDFDMQAWFEHVNQPFFTKLFKEDAASAITGPFLSNPVIELNPEQAARTTTLIHEMTHLLQQQQPFWSTVDPTKIGFDERREVNSAVLSISDFITGGFLSPKSRGLALRAINRNAPYYNSVEESTARVAELNLLDPMGAQRLAPQTSDAVQRTFLNLSPVLGGYLKEIRERAMSGPSLTTLLEDDFQPFLADATAEGLSAGMAEGIDPLNALLVQLAQYLSADAAQAGAIAAAGQGLPAGAAAAAKKAPWYKSGFFASSEAAIIGQLLGTYGGSKLGGGGQGASIGSTLGSVAGGAFLGPLGAAGGGIIGGLLGGLLDGQKEENENVVVPALQAIERSQKDTIKAIENQTDALLRPENQLINLPTTFRVPNYAPAFGSAASVAGQTDNRSVTININGGDLNEVRRVVDNALNQQLGGNRTRGWGTNIA